MTFNSRDKKQSSVFTFSCVYISSYMDKKTSGLYFISAEFKDQVNFKRVIWNSFGCHTNNLDFK